MQKLFLKNHFVLNPGKSHYMLIVKEDHPAKINISGIEITRSNNKRVFVCSLIKTKL